MRGVNTVLPEHIIMNNVDEEELCDLLREKGYMWVVEEDVIYATR